MKLYIVVTEKDSRGILFAKIHYDSITPTEGWEIVSSQPFALKGKANFHLKHVRYNYKEHNLSIDPEYVKKNLPRSYNKSKAQQGRQPAADGA